MMDHVCGRSVCNKLLRCLAMMDHVCGRSVCNKLLRCVAMMDHVCQPVCGRSVCNKLLRCVVGQCVNRLLHFVSMMDYFHSSSLSALMT